MRPRAPHRTVRRREQARPPNVQVPQGTPPTERTPQATEPQVPTSPSTKLGFAFEWAFPLSARFD
ncbi:MAG TPA: hypothetical protein VFA57_10395 [Pseudolabrys sp.]|nr:hypothetical protein [Pseudolabrys sp.]